MAEYFDPWKGANQTTATLAALGRQIDDERRTQIAADAQKMHSQLADLQVQQNQFSLNDAMAQQEALKQAYATPDLAEAYARQMKAVERQKQMDKFFTTIDNFKKAGASPQFLTEYTKTEMGKDPELAKIAPFVNYMDGETLEITRPFADNELPDPSKPGTFLPAGTYTVKGKRTGDPANPFAPTGITPAKPDQMEILIKRDELAAERERIRQEAADKKLEKTLAAQDARLSRTLAAHSTGEKADMYEKRAAFGELPKLRQDAQSAVQAMPRIKRMQEILSSGNAGGIKSTMQRWLAPYAPEAKNANESALFEIFARLVSGPQRVNIIGPGPQTEKEGQLLALVGGGGTQGRAALRELLQMHEQGYVAKISEYNGMIEAAGTKIYKPISLPGGNNNGDKGNNNAPAVPKAGQVIKGYRFKGGNPANKNNWVKV